MRYRAKYPPAWSAASEPNRPATKRHDAAGRKYSAASENSLKKEVDRCPVRMKPEEEKIIQARNPTDMKR